jgi:hypothetical protein
LGRNEPRTRLHATCERCGNEVAPDDPTCACGAPRPEGGWPAVAQLVVLPGGPKDSGPKEEAAEVVEPDPPAAAPEVAPEAAGTEPTVPVRVESASPRPRRPAREPGALGIYLRLIGTFVVTFCMTSGLVLGAWFGWLRPERHAQFVQPNPAFVAPPAMVQPPQVAVAEPPAPAPAATEPVEPPADAVADAEPAPEPAPVHHHTYHRPTPPNPTPTVVQVPAPAPAAPEPTTEVAAAPVPTRSVVPAPKPEPVPADVALLSGVYVGRASGRPLSLTLKFQPGDNLAATLMVNDGTDTQTIDATGTWTLGDDGSVTIALVENAVADPKAYSGNVDGAGLSGHIIQGGRNRGRFYASR